MDCRPFTILDGAGFKKPVKSYLDIGTKYGSQLHVLNIDSLHNNNNTPDSRHSSRKTMKLKKELRTAIKSETECLICDLLAEYFVQGNFLYATFHPIKNFKLKEIVLGFKPHHFHICSANNVLLKIIQFCKTLT